MNIKSVNSYYSSYKPTFGIKILNDSEFRQTASVLKRVYPDSDKFIKAIKDSTIGGTEDAVNMGFFPITLNDSGQAVIRYSFWKNREAQPLTDHYRTVIDNLDNMLNEILKDCTRFISGEDNQIIEQLNRIELEKRLDRGLPLGNLKFTFEYLCSKLFK